MAVLEQIVLDDLKTLIQNVGDLRELVSVQHFSASKMKRIADTELSKLRSELERVKRLKQSVYEDYKEELITKEDFLSYREDYQKKKNFTQNRLKHWKKRKMPA